MRLAQKHTVLLPHGSAPWHVGTENEIFNSALEIHLLRQASNKRVFSPCNPTLEGSAPKELSRRECAESEMNGSLMGQVSGEGRVQ